MEAFSCASCGITNEFVDASTVLACASPYISCICSCSPCEKDWSDYVAVLCSSGGVGSGMP